MAHVKLIRGNKSLTYYIFKAFYNAVNKKKQGSMYIFFHNDSFPERH